jgi:hypothetical protein
LLKAVEPGYATHILLIAARRFHSPAQNPSAWSESDGLAACPGSGELFVARAARRDPGGLGWESLHLFEFRIRAVRYGSSDICPEPPDKTLESFAFRKNARFAYVYDMGDWWEHEIRVEDREVVKERARSTGRALASRLLPAGFRGGTSTRTFARMSTGG